jgi:ferredoxin
VYKKTTRSYLKFRTKKASLKEISEEIDQEKLMKAVNSCPVKAISISADEN